MGFDNSAAEAAMDAIDEALSMMRDPHRFGDLTLEEHADIKGWDADDELSERGRKSVVDVSDNLENLQGSIWEAYEAIEAALPDALGKAAREVADGLAQIPDAASVTAAFEEAVDRVYEDWKKDAVETLKTKVVCVRDGSAAVLEAVDRLLGTDG